MCNSFLIRIKFLSDVVTRFFNSTNKKQSVGHPGTSYIYYAAYILVECVDS